MKLTIRTFELPLRHVFTISRDSIATQPTLIVELEQDGVRGYGEATTNKYYGATLENMSAVLEAVRATLLEHNLLTKTIDNPESLWDALAPQFRTQPFALCALDQAAHDLWGKLKGQPVYKLWGLSTDRLPLTNYTIGIDTVEKMVAKMNEMPGDRKSTRLNSSHT